jgi:methyl-accepting chemotaxis protein
MEWLLSRLRISFQIFLVGSVGLSGLIFQIGLFALNIPQQNRAAKATQLAFADRLVAMRLAPLVLQARLEEKNYEAQPVADAAARFDKAIQEIRVAAQPLADQLSDSKGASLSAAFGAGVAAYVDQFAAVRRMTGGSGKSSEAGAKLAASYERLSTARADLDRYVTATYDDDFATQNKLQADGRQMLLVSIATIMIAVVLVVWIVARAISRPIVALTETTERLASGDLAALVVATGRRDEVGRLARSLQIFKENEVAARGARAEKERMQAELSHEKDGRAVRLADLLGAFDRSMSGMLGNVVGAADQLQATAHAMLSTAEKTSREATEVSGAATNASTNAQAVAGATEELSASIQEINRQVDQSAKLTTETAERASAAMETVRRLASGSQRIGEVVDLINSIAGQTNLLALNATIEAARAGDAGKGFAVVAAEVKQLATQTAQATGDISELIAAIQQATESTVTAIEAISATVDTVSGVAVVISGAVTEQRAATQEIARSVQQTAAGTETVQHHVSGLSGGAEATRSAAGEVLSSASELACQAEMLRGEVARFLVDVKAA